MRCHQLCSPQALLELEEGRCRQGQGASPRHHRPLKSLLCFFFVSNDRAAFCTVAEAVPSANKCSCVRRAHSFTHAQSPLEAGNLPSHLSAVPTHTRWRIGTRLKFKLASDATFKASFKPRSLKASSKALGWRGLEPRFEEQLAANLASALPHGSLGPRRHQQP